jgi:hypothetical protein
MHWGMTAVSGTDTLGAAGSAAVKIRLQHDFRAQDVTFTGSAAGAKVTSIFFGDRVVWSSSDGIDVSVFGSTSFLRGLLKGQSLRAGLDITVNGTPHRRGRLRGHHRRREAGHPRTAEHGGDRGSTGVRTRAHHARGPGGPPRPDPAHGGRGHPGKPVELLEHRGRGRHLAHRRGVQPPGCPSSWTCPGRRGPAAGRRRRSPSRGRRGSASRPLAPHLTDQNLAKKINRAGVTVADGFAITRNTWEVPTGVAEGTPLEADVPPFAETFRIELAELAAYAVTQIAVKDALGVVRSTSWASRTSAPSRPTSASASPRPRPTAAR